MGARTAGLRPALRRGSSVRGRRETRAAGTYRLVSHRNWLIGWERNKAKLGLREAKVRKGRQYLRGMLAPENACSHSGEVVVGAAAIEDVLLARLAVEQRAPWAHPQLVDGGDVRVRGCHNGDSVRGSAVNKWGWGRGSGAGEKKRFVALKRTRYN